MLAHTYYGSPERLKTAEMLAGVANCGRTRKWGYRGCSRLGFKVKAGPHKGVETMQHNEGGQCEILQGRKGVEGLSLVSHEKVPRGFGLRTGDCSDTADGAGDCGELAQLSIDD